MRQRLLLIICFFTLYTAKVNGRQYILERINASNFSENIIINGIVKDTSGYLWLATHIGLYRFDGSNFERFPGVGNDIQTILYAKNHVLWISSNTGLIKISENRKDVKIYGKLLANSIAESSKGDIFFTTKEEGLFKINVLDEIKLLTPSFKRENQFSNHFYKILIDESDQIWIKEQNKLYLFDENGNYLTSYPTLRDHKDFCIVSTHNKIFLSHNLEPKLGIINLSDGSMLEKPLTDQVHTNHDIRSTLFHDSKNRLWVAHLASIMVHDIHSGVTHFLNADQYDLIQNHTYVNSILEYAPDLFYLGTSTGLYKLKIKESKFGVIDNKTLSNYLADEKFFSIRSLSVQNEYLSIGSYSGFFEYGLKTQQARKFLHYTLHYPQGRNRIAYDQKLLENGDLLIGSEGGSLLIKEKNADRINWLRVRDRDPSNIDPKRPQTTYCVRGEQSSFVLGTATGLYAYENNEYEKLISPHVELNNSRVYHLYQDDEVYYIGSTAGLYKMENQEVVRINLDSSFRYTINYIHKEENILWLGTRGEGLLKYDLDLELIEKFGYDQGMIDLTVNAITNGNDEGVWFSTNKGVSRFDRKTRQIKHFFVENELPWTEFNHNAFAKDDEGILYFGGIGGVVYFNPSDMVDQHLPSELVLNKVTKRNHKEGTTHSTIFGIDPKVPIQLKYFDRYFSIEFSKSNLLPTPGDQFSYRIQGTEWINLGNNRSIQFTGLEPGKYTLDVKGVDQDGYEISPISIPVIVDQIFYRTLWAKAIYLFFGIGLISWIFRNLLLKSQLQSRLRLERSYSNQLKELDKAKTRIFSNLAHEFQTPLTLIQGPAYKIHQNAVDDKQKKWSASIVQNSRSLMEMIQQLLRLSRLDEGQYDLKWTKGDLMGLLKGVTHSFGSMAGEKEISLIFECDETSLWCQYDESKIRHILKNLISNALKFNKPGGEVLVNVQRKYDEAKDSEELHLKVKDTGIGIAEKHLPNIFNRFYQEDDSETRKVGGTGIGLALVKEFVELMDGKISVTSKKGKGSTFYINLPIEPIDELNVALKAIDSMQGHGESNEIFLGEKDQVLLVEDNPDVRAFIVDCLPENVRIKEATNGMEGCRLALESIPDLIIMDVMMPEKDGFTLAKELKENPLSSHIPCIMLTAKGTDEARLKGRKSGVEAYLTKPFNPEELKYTVENLLNLKKEIERSALKEKKIVTFQDDFMNSLQSLVDQELDNPDLDVKMIIMKLAVSRTQLHRKVKSITGKSINQFVREYRLMKARELLLHKNATVSEVCYYVGFTHPSYFAARFKEFFGELPSEL